jgi:hypothetical protein
MSTRTLVAAVAGIAVVAAVLSWILLSTRKNRQLDPEHTVALIDFRVRNPSTQQFMVREVEVFIDEKDGKSTPADVFSETDIRRVIDYYTTLGKKYSPGLLRRDRINSGESTDRSTAVNAPMTDERFAARKALRIVVHDSDGARTEIVEKR